MCFVMLCVVFVVLLRLQAVFVDPDGTVLYGSNCSIGLLTTDNTLVLPPDEAGLSGMAVQVLAARTLEVRACLFVGCWLLLDTNIRYRVLCRTPITIS